MDSLRSYRLIGLPIIDLIGGAMITSIAGQLLLRNLNNGILFNALMSIPIGLIAHVTFGIETPLTKYIKEKPEHLLHSVAIGLLTGGIVRNIIGYNNGTAMTATLGMSIASLTYMFNYGHRLPKPVRKKMMRMYIRYFL
jgi:hypothetical protein